MSDEAGEVSIFDEIQEAIDEHQDKIAAIFCEPVQLFISARSAKDHTAAAPLLAAPAIVMRIKFALDEVESWFSEFHNSAVTECASDAGVDPAPHLAPIGPHRWLRDDMSEALAVFAKAQDRLHGAAESHAAFLRENTVGAGLIKGLGDILSIVGGPKAIVERGKDMISQFKMSGELDMTWGAVAADYENAATLLRETLHHVLWHAINNRTVVALRSIASDDER